MTVFSTVFDSRGYELDVDARVPAHTWLRYMEHLRWEHTIRDFPEISALFRKGHTIVVVAQTLRIIRDIGVAVPIRGSIWIGRTGRTSMVFNHTFHHADEEDLLAGGNITAVYLGEHGKPNPLPDTLRRANPDSSMMPDLTPPKFAEMPPAPFEYPYRVRTSDLDFLKHMNQANYAALFDDARQAAADRNAYGPGGLGLGRIQFLHIEYLNPALLGEKLVVSTWKIGSDPLSLGFTMHRPPTLLSRAYLGVGPTKS